MHRVTKAVAVAAKAAELRDMGIDVPEVVAIEKTGALTATSGASGARPGRRPTSAREAPSAQRTASATTCS